VQDDAQREAIRSRLRVEFDAVSRNATDATAVDWTIGALLDSPPTESTFRTAVEHLASGVDTVGDQLMAPIATSLRQLQQQRDQIATEQHKTGVAAGALQRTEARLAGTLADLLTQSQPPLVEGAKSLLASFSHGVVAGAEHAYFRLVSLGQDSASNPTFPTQSGAAQAFTPDSIGDILTPTGKQHLDERINGLTPAVGERNGGAIPALPRVDARAVQRIGSFDRAESQRLIDRVREATDPIIRDLGEP
jgi:hypothetical protein